MVPPRRNCAARTSCPESLVPRDHRGQPISDGGDIEMCIALTLTVSIGQRRILTRQSKASKIYDFVFDDEKKNSNYSLIFHNFQDICIWNMHVIVFDRWNGSRSTVNMSIEWVKVNCKYVNRMAKHDFLFDGNTNFYHIHYHFHDIQCKIYMILTSTFRIRQDEIRR